MDILTPHVIVIACSALAVAVLFAFEKFSVCTARWIISLVLVPILLVVIAFLSYGVTGGMLYTAIIIPIYFVGVAFGRRSATTNFTDRAHV